FTCRSGDRRHRPSSCRAGNPVWRREQVVAAWRARAPVPAPLGVVAAEAEEAVPASRPREPAPLDAAAVVGAAVAPPARPSRALAAPAGGGGEEGGAVPGLSVA